MTNKVKGKSKNRLDGNNLNEKEEREIKITRQEPGEADPGVISEDEDEFTVSKSSGIVIRYILAVYNVNEE